LSEYEFEKKKPAKKTITVFKQSIKSYCNFFTRHCFPDWK